MMFSKVVFVEALPALAVFGFSDGVQAVRQSASKRGREVREMNGFM